MRSVLFFIFLSVLLSSCDCSRKERKPVKVLLLVDKSESIQAGIGELPRNLKNLINDSITNGSILDIYFINSNTMNAAFKTIPINLKEVDKNAGGMTKDNANANFDKKLKRKISEWKEGIKQALIAENNRQTSHETDIWGSLAGIQEYFKSDSKKHLYIFSDMVHSKDGINHHTKVPGDEQEARVEANQHLSKMKAKYSLVEDALKDVHINIVFPGKAGGADKNNIMKAYWRAVFESLGAKDIVFE